jgi:hypothetical protein
MPTFPLRKGFAIGVVDFFSKYIVKAPGSRTL